MDSAAANRFFRNLPAGAAFHIAGLAPNLQSGVNQAWEIIASGTAWERVEQLRKLSRG